MAAKKKGAAKAAKKVAAPRAATARTRTAARSTATRSTTEADRKPSKTNAEVRKAEADAVNKAAGTPPTPAERKAFLSKFVGELNSRPDAQERTIKQSLPTLSRYFGIDIPEVDMNVRDHAAPPAPGPMTRPARVDPADLVNADKGQVAKLAPPAGGDQAAAVVALGEAQK